LASTGKPTNSALLLECLSEAWSKVRSRFEERSDWPFWSEADLVHHFLLYYEQLGRRPEGILIHVDSSVSPNLFKGDLKRGLEEVREKFGPKIRFDIIAHRHDDANSKFLLCGEAKLWLGKLRWLPFSRFTESCEAAVKRLGYLKGKVCEETLLVVAYDPKEPVDQQVRDLEQCLPKWKQSTPVLEFVRK